jgi:GPH family glycoside/pentoside/hexuronide:cation symporter
VGKLGYGSGDYALNLFWQSVGFYLFFYYDEVIGLPASWVGVIFIIAGIWDAISDPLAGYVTERTETRWGVYRPYILFGTIPLAISFAFLFFPIEFDNQYVLAAYIVVILLLFRTFYTFVSIAYSALSARLTSPGPERIKLISVRMYCGFLGGLSVTALAGYLQERYPDSQAFPILGFACALAAIVVLLACFKSTTEYTRSGSTDRPALSLEELRETLLNNPAFISITLGIFAVTVANTFVGTGLLYYFEHIVGNRLAGNSAIFIMIGTPIWSFVAIKIGFKKTWLIGCFVGAIGVATLFTDTQSVIISVGKFGLIAIGLSAFSVLFWNMLPDAIEYGEKTTKVRNEAIIVGIASSFQKISGALSAFIFGFLIDAFEIGSSAITHNSEALVLILVIAPIMALAAASLSIRFYPDGMAV